MEHEEEPEITLEEQIRILQEEGLPAEKIVERVLVEDFNADINILANTLKMDKLAIGRIKGRLSRLRKRREEKEAAEKREEAKAEEGPYKGELDTTAILRDILTKHPDISPKIVGEVLSWAEYGPIHPTQLVYLLQSMRGISSTTANIVAQKYSLALQRAQQEGKQTIPPFMAGVGSQPQNQWGFQFMPFGSTPTTPSPGYPQSPYMPSAPQPQPGQPWYPPQPIQQDVRSAIREELDRREERRSKESEQYGYVDIEDPVRDREGNVILGSDDRPIMKHIRMPASQAGELVAPREDMELKMLEKMKHYKDLFGSKEELTESKIREIIRQEAKPEAPTEKAVTPEEVKSAAAEAASSAVKSFIESHEKEDNEEARFRRLEDTIRSTASAKTVEGYKEDSYRIIGQGLSEVGGALKERKPIEVLVREGGPLILGGSSAKEVEAGAGEGLIARLQKRGWVTEQ